MDQNTTSSIQLKVSNPYANGRMIVYADGTGRLVRSFIDYVPSEQDDYHVVSNVDTITGIAYKRYKDLVDLPSHYWWIIADANGIKNPLDLTALIAKQIVIPNILNFKLANQ